MNGIDTVAELAARFALGGDQEEALETYVDLLAGWRLGNVTGLHSHAQIVETLLGDALALLDVPQLLERADAGWLDLGAGAGIPGIPLAVVLPSAELTLLESAAKKCVFLQAAVAAAGLAAARRALGSWPMRLPSASGSVCDCHPGAHCAGPALARVGGTCPGMRQISLWSRGTVVARTTV